MSVPITLTRILSTVALSVSVIAVAACTPQPGPVAPTSAPSDPVSSSAPDPSPSPTLAQEDKDRAEAEAAYRRASDLVDEVAMIKGPKKLTNELESVADPMGPWYRNQDDAIQRYNRENLHWDRMSTVVESKAVRISNPNRIILFSCIDARDVRILNAKGESAEETVLIAGYLTMRKSEEFGWRVFGYDTRGFVEVKECSDAEFAPSELPS